MDADKRNAFDIGRYLKRVRIMPDDEFSVFDMGALIDDSP